MYRAMSGVQFPHMHGFEKYYWISLVAWNLKYGFEDHLGHYIELFYTKLQSTPSMQDHAVTDLFLEHIEVINDDTDEEIEGEEGANNDEDAKEEIGKKSGFTFWLLVNLKYNQEIW